MLRAVLRRRTSGHPPRPVPCREGVVLLRTSASARTFISHHAHPTQGVCFSTAPRFAMGFAMGGRELFWVARRGNTLPCGYLGTASLCRDVQQVVAITGYRIIGSGVQHDSTEVGLLKQ